MVVKIRNFSNNQHSIFHRDIIKVLIVEELNKFKKYWKLFLLYYEFETLEAKYSQITSVIFFVKSKPLQFLEDVKADDFIT